MLVSRPDPGTNNAAPSGWFGGYFNQSTTGEDVSVFAICG
jgi:hypothetical protein